MKKFLASATVAGLMTGGLVATGAGAFAAEPGTGDPAAQPAARTDRHAIRRAALRAAREAAAGALGITVAELDAGVPQGSTIAELAAAKGVALDDVTSAIVGALGDAVDQAVTDGRITPERAAAVEERLPELADRYVHHVRGSRRGGDAPANPDA